MRQRGTRDVEGAFQIDIDDGAEAVRREIFGEADEVARGAVDQDVEAAQLRHDGGNRVVDRRGIPHVGRHRDRTNAEGAQFGRRRLEMFDLAAGDRDVAAVGRERERNPAADAGAAAGNQRDAILEEGGLKHGRHHIREHRHR